jgi:hypothetical protein
MGHHSIPPRTIFYTHCTIDSHNVVVEVSLEGQRVSTSLPGVTADNRSDLCDYVYEQRKIVEAEGRMSKEHIPAPPERGWKGGYRYEHWHFRIGEIPRPPWLEKAM